jgi:hypothetical protein
MGAWGYHPVESDMGQEFYAEALQDVVAKVRKGLRSDFTVEVFACADLLQRLGYQGIWPGDLALDLTAGIVALKRLLSYDGKSLDWDDVEEWKKGVRQLLGTVEARSISHQAPGTKSLGGALGIGPDGTFTD